MWRYIYIYIYGTQLFKPHICKYMYNVPYEIGCFIIHIMVVELYSATYFGILYIGYNKEGSGLLPCWS